MENTFFINQINIILNEYHCIKDFNYLKPEIESKLTTKSTALISRITGNRSEYYKDVQYAFSKRSHHNAGKLRYIIGILVALKEDLENNFLISHSELIRADVFSDYIDMAKHLLDEGYKDASAVIIGSTLENHIINLCIKNNIEITFENQGKIKPKNANRLNANLKKENAYNEARKKQIDAWQEIRNKSAHGEYDEYNKNEIKLMLQGVRDFIINFPA